MSIHGIGVDLVKIARIAAFPPRRLDRFARRICHPAELARYVLLLQPRTESRRDTRPGTPPLTGARLQPLAQLQTQARTQAHTQLRPSSALQTQPPPPGPDTSGGAELATEGLRHEAIAQWLASRWCIKEAVFKASSPYRPTFRQICTDTGADGAPTVHIAPLDDTDPGNAPLSRDDARDASDASDSRVREVNRDVEVPLRYKISLSHDGEYVVASVISLLLDDSASRASSGAGTPAGQRVRHHSSADREAVDHGQKRTTDKRGDGQMAVDLERDLPRSKEHAHAWIDRW